MSSLIDGSSAVSSTRSGLRKSRFPRGAALESLGPDRLERPHRLDPKSFAVLAIQAALAKTTLAASASLTLPRLSRRKMISRLRKAHSPENEIGLARLFERIVEEPLDERVKLAVLFEDVKDVVVPAIFADQISSSAAGDSAGFASGCLFIRLPSMCKRPLSGAP